IGSGFVSICQNHRIHRQKEERHSLIISFFMYICRHFAIKVAAVSNKGERKEGKIYKPCER
ncbi:hypothetical protein, partial [Pseudoneobacillus sp. C159]